MINFISVLNFFFLIHSNFIYYFNLFLFFFYFFFFISFSFYFHFIFLHNSFMYILFDPLPFHSLVLVSLNKRHIKTND